MLVFMNDKVASAAQVSTYKFVTPVLFSEFKALSDNEAFDYVNKLYSNYFTAERGKWVRKGDFEFHWVEN